MRIALFGSNSSITQSLIPLLKEDHELFTLGRSNANFIVVCHFPLFCSSPEYS